ncbi:Arginine N-succinyltransferase subunit beta [Marinomonas aquimarina]|uniref:Arginine N-succinyltransferase subunit beta n=1 Tax=Marinomonas aquimarina TaxID=295068 RepID=A0A1A8T3L8_9GAMM|nr:arginine N-succinyltransferase [Marinomonas aquimarina]SBS25663.1 Arginine N-succinyltransferase subunit beta [Marinomonas aquimarina]
MYLVRPADFPDLPALERLARQAGIGITNFPANRERLNDKIAASRQSLLSDVVQPGNESYLFVMVEQTSQTIVGTCSIDAMVGVDAPFYSYRIDDVVHASPQLQIHNRVPALFLCHDYSGTTRLSSLVLDQEHQNAEALAILSRARLLFIARHPDRFTSKIFAEIRGESDHKGYSPFWEALGRHFFSMDFKKADYLSGISNKHFIAELMPRYPIYVPTLPEDAQDVIGVFHPDSEKVANILLDEGFVFRDYVDIFDAGPTIEARVQDLKTVTQQRQGKALFDPNFDHNEHYLIAAGHLHDFRVTCAEAEPQVAGLVMDNEIQDTMSIHSGSLIQWSKL